jgi:hypothetical protein
MDVSYRAHIHRVTEHATTGAGNEIRKTRSQPAGPPDSRAVTGCVHNHARCVPMIKPGEVSLVGGPSPRCGTTTYPRKSGMMAR